MTKRILLTQGHYALVDDADYPALRRFKWYYTRQGYAARTARVEGRSRTLLMHRELLEARGVQYVDHIDGDRLNNQRANLRIATAAQNQQNRKLPKTGATGYKGVTFANGRWMARIYVEGRAIHLGYHDTAQQAALIYDHAARRFFGRYARLNIKGPQMGMWDRRLDAILTGTQPKRKRQPKPGVPKRRSLYRGVYWDRGRWRATIKVDGAKQHLGYFMDETEAARAYDRAVVARDGERALLNFFE